MLERLVQARDGSCLVRLDKPAGGGHQRQADDKDGQDRLAYNGTTKDLLGRRDGVVALPARHIAQCKEGSEQCGDSPEERMAQADVLPVYGLRCDQFNADVTLRGRRDIRSARRAALDEWGQVAPRRRVASLLIGSGTVVHARPVLQLAIHQDAERTVRVGHGVRCMQVCRRDLSRCDRRGHRVHGGRQTEIRRSGEVLPRGGMRSADKYPYDRDGEKHTDECQSESSTQRCPRLCSAGHVVGRQDKNQGDAHGRTAQACPHGDHQ